MLTDLELHYIQFGLLIERKRQFFNKVVRCEVKITLHWLHGSRGKCAQRERGEGLGVGGRASGGGRSVPAPRVACMRACGGQRAVLCLPAGAAVAGIYRVAGKNMAPLEALVWGVGQTVLTLIISFSRILATL